MAATSESPLFSSLAKAFTEILSKEIEKTGEEKKKKKSKKSKKEEKTEDKKPKREVEEKQVIREGANSLITYPNASGFSVFSHIRHFVLQNQLCSTLNSRVILGKTDSSDSEDEGEEETGKKEEGGKMPVMVGLGVKGVFVIIREIRHSHPELCLKTLTEFSNILCEQAPAALKNEPKETTDSLFELLMEMVQASGESEEASVSERLSSVVSRCLISLVVALGDTGKMLAALAAMLTAPGNLTAISVQIPQIIYSLQSSVQAVLLGGVADSNWTNQGVPSKSLMETWSLSSEVPIVSSSGGIQPSITGDGSYLYLHGTFGLLKIGSGYGNKERGKVYLHNADFMNDTFGWIGFTSGKLLFFPVGGDLIYSICPNSLTLKDTLELEADSVGPSCMFSDSEGLGQILAKKEGGFVLRRLSTLASPMPCVEEKSLPLSQKSLLGMGRVKHDPQESQHTIYQDSVEEVVRVLASKNFVAVQTASGKLLYSGGGQVWGVQGKEVPRGEWKVVELPDKNVKVEHCSSDNAGSCSLVISDKGVAYFGGVNKKGESGEPAGRQPKPTKLKRIARVKDSHIMRGACGGNNCCLVAKDGKIFMFGPTEGDIVDKNTGVLTDLLGVPASQVAMGRSHVCILAQNGGVYTFGNNQYGQCGRDFVPQPFSNEDEAEESGGSDDDGIEMCEPGEHQWERQVCMICRMCNYCTGYGPGCCNQGLPDRVPGNECGCGSGDSGCKVCGCCRVCAGDNAMWEGMFQMEREDMDVVEAVKEKAQKRREKKNKKKRKLDRENSMGLKLLFGGGAGGSEKEASEEDDGSSMASKPGPAPPPVPSTKKPKMISLPEDQTAMQVDCGTFHTAVLLHSGEVYTFGNDNHGQLGQSGCKSKISAVPVKVSLPGEAVQVACGDNHTVVLLADGQVFTFGKCMEGQLGRIMKEKDVMNWHMSPRPVPGFDDRCRATWVGAQGNQTFIAVDETLVAESSLSKYRVFSNNQMLGLVPPPSESGRKANLVALETTTLKAKKFDDDEQQDLCGCSLYMDQDYNLLWAFNPQDGYFSCFNPLAASLQDCAGTILSSSICLPQSKKAATSCSHLATNLLSCLATLASSPPLTVDALTGTSQKFDKDSFSCVVRFNAHGGGWGYSASSMEAIRFSPDTDVMLGGFGLYGGRGTYNADVKVYELGASGGESETDGTLLTSQNESGYSCEKQQTYRVLFDKPVLLQADHWYVVCGSITSPSGSSSDAGSSGQAVLTGDKVVFKIKASKKSNNGTDVGSGQIPEILYRIPTPEKDSGLQVQLLDKAFSTTVSANGLDAVLQLLEWSWSLLTVGLRSSPPMSSGDSSHLAFVAKSSLLLLQTYIQEAYPKQKSGKSKQAKDTQELAEMAYRAQLLLRRILSTRSRPAVATEKSSADVAGSVDPLSMVIEACCTTFRVCFHAFYPTTSLKWLCLCQHLQLLDPNDVVSGAPMENLLCAVLDALAEPEVSNIGLAYDRTMSINAAIFNSEPDPTFPILSEYMQMKVLAENGDGELLSFDVVATKLLSVVTAPVRNALQTKQTQILESLVVSKAGLLLQSRINELALCIAYPESAVMSGLPVFKSETKEKVLESSVRFSTTEVGHPSLAVTGVAFSVNKTILLQGVTVYGGSNHSYDYKVNIIEGTQVVTSCEGTFTEAEYYGRSKKYVNIAFKNPAKLEAEVVYVARVEMKGASFSVGVEGSTSFTGPGDVLFTMHSMASEDCKADTGPLAKFLYSLPSSCGPQSVVQMSVHLSSTLLEVTVSFLQRALSENLSMDMLGLLGSSFLFSTLLPTTLAQLGPVACKHPKFAVEVLDLVKSALPVAAAAAKLAGILVRSHSSSDVEDGGGSNSDMDTDKTSSGLVGLHYATVETDHPYKQAAVSHFKVKFNDKVQWMSLEFDPRTGFAQKEDKMGDLLISRGLPVSQSSLSSSPLSPSSSSSTTTNTGLSSTITSSSHSSQLSRTVSEHVQQLVGVGLEDLYADWERYSLDFPRGLVLLPGNEVHIVVNADTEYEKRDNMNHYGMKCQVVGYEWTSKPNNCLLFLEKELATLGSMCAASLLKNNTLLPFAEELTISTKDGEKADMRLVQASAEEVLKNHGYVLCRGLLVESPNIQNILSGNISIVTDSNEQKFLQDFIDSKADTAGGRLACWLQPDRAVNPKASELILPTDSVISGTSSVFTVNTRDQDGKLVHVEGMKVEVKAMWMGKKEEGHGSLRDRLVDSVMGVTKPTFKRSYSATRLNSNYLYHCMSMMMAYSDYSFEELRLFAPKVKKSSESMPLKSNKDGTYTVNWVPSVAGSYVIQIFIDSTNTGKEYTVEVSEPELETSPDTEEKDQDKTLAPSKEEEEEEMVIEEPVVKMKVLKEGGVRGVRIRAAPSLSSEAFGLVNPGDFFTYEEEFENQSGRWVKLTPEAKLKLNCRTSTNTAYVLSYNTEKDLQLLDEKEVPKQTRKVKKSSSGKQRSGGSGVYHVVYCGAAGHNIRSKPGIKGTPVGRLTKGNTVDISDEIENEDGIWLKLTGESAKQYCSSEMEAWTLAVGLSGRMFLAAEGDDCSQAQALEAKSSEAKAASMFPTAASVFGTPQQSVFGSTLPPSTFQFPSMKPIKLKFGSNDVPSQPPSQDVSKPFKFGLPSDDGRSSGGDKEKPPPANKKDAQPSAVPRASVAERIAKARSQQKKPPPPPSVASQSNVDSSQEAKEDKEDKEESEDGTDNMEMESASSTSEKMELKGDLGDEDTKGSSTTESLKSSGLGPAPSTELGPSTRTVKQALSPAVAECQRAVFAAFLWQESLVHDAMASATYLKFHPELTKELRQIIERESCLKRYESEDGSASSDKDGLLVAVSSESEADRPNEVFQQELPPTLGHLVTLWDEISTKVVDNSSATLPMPEVPALAQELQNQYESEKKELEKRKKDKDKKVVSPPAGGSTVCELCDQSYLDPVTYHMKDIHPGCGKHANGWGYNSRGAYCSGWAGNCGDGGRGGSTWYLLCKDCHARYLAMKDDVRKKAVKSVVLPKLKTKKPGKPRNLPVLTAVQGMIMNAKFLLEIARSSESTPTTPQLKSPSMSEFVTPELLRQVSTPLDSTTPSLSGGASLGGPSVLTKSGSLPHDTSGNEEDGIAAIAEQKFREQVKRPSYLRSISEAHRPEPSQRASIDVVQSPGDVSKKIFKIPGREELKKPVLDNTSSSSLMVKPSKNLRQLIYRRSRSNPENKDMGYRRVMEFVLHNHDLDGLRVSMKQSMRVAGLRAFAMEFLEWLLLKVHEPSIVHDVLWQFNCALANHPVASNKKEDNDDKEKEEDAELKGLNHHPLTGLDGAGIMLHFLRKQFHSFLKAASNIMPKLPAGSVMQQEAMQCYYIQFQPQDHSFLLQSNVFSNISKALSLPEEQQGESSKASKEKEIEACMMEDVLPEGKLAVSSNEAMSNSLTDKSTETFWESRDEPRSKPKMITVTFDGAGISVFGVAVHVDNQKDAGQRVDKLTLWVGKDEDSLKDVAKVSLSVTHCGWKTLLVPPADSTHITVVRVQVDGHQNKVRVRQVQILALPSKIVDCSHPAATAQQKSCEAEALRVFRSLTSQVFGGLLSAKPEVSIDETDGAPVIEGADKEGGKEGDVRDHMVGILFTKGNLSGLQKQVCDHIIQSVHTEMLRMKDDWETNCSKPPAQPSKPSAQPAKPSKQLSSEPSSTNTAATAAPSVDEKDSDSYCYELLSMLLGLSQSEVGCSFLAEQGKLMDDLSTLLHVGSVKIQLQVCSLFRKILPIVGPKAFAPMVHVRFLPPLGYSAIAEAVIKTGTINQLGLLDCFLAVISKALSVQVKAKGRSSNILTALTGASNLTSLSMENLVSPKPVPGETTIKSQRWYLKGGMSKVVAGEVVKLIKDMIEGSLGAQWEGYSKSAVGQAVLHLTKINEEARMPVPGMYSQNLWLCLAALCVIDKEHAEALSSGQWLGQDGKPKSKPLCDNHDDGETEALILCNVCGNLCGECDRVLHYSKKNKDHQRQIFKEEEEAVKVELHEGCGRIKLYWTMALADCRTLKGMIEFKESGSGGGKGACRFCGTTSGTSLQPIGYVCSDPECIQRTEDVCDKTLPCGHPCNGVRGEDECLPCLHQGCADASSKLRQDADDMCMICYTEGLSCAPCIQLECGHVFHYQCCRSTLVKKWSGPRITFRFMFCSICVNTKIGHPKLGDILGPITDLYEDVKKKCMMRIEYENQMKCEAITDPSSKFYEKPLEFAMWKYAYYVCFKCSKSYYGGDANCAEQVSASDEYDPSELVCPPCSHVGGPVQDCPKHGVDFLEYKCRYCCSVAVFFCFGTTHFCNPCHDDFQRLTSIPKSDLPQCPVGPCAKPLEGTECPLHVKHPPTGEEFALGCGVCRNAQTF